MKRLIICILAIAIILTFSACSVSKSGETTTAYTQPTEPSTIAETTTEPETEPTVEITEPIINLTEADAKNAAYDALKENYSGERSYEILGCDYTAFEFSGIELLKKDEGYIAYNRGYGGSSATENFSGHAYYCVTYENTTQLCDFAYICIDAVNGDLLFSGYMGD
ncbi:MAG: hypothetical protein J1E36_02515 [Eubacterium sp.]|nr:hypothetical protein [Eubacterium sp.]